ncbi:MAG: MGDG synthase family glycosyltransferase [Microcystaceae cyanobacterium]
MTQPLRFLLLTSNTGYAHNAAANAIKEWGAIFYGEKVIIEIEHLLENSNRRYYKLVNLYNFIQRNIPWLHNLYYLILEFQQEIQSTQPFKPFIGRKYWTERLKDFRPDVIISTHCQINLGYFDLAKQILGDRLICVTYCTEIDGGCGFTHNWINQKVDIFWTQTPEVDRQALKMGLRPQQIFAGGTLLNPSFYASAVTDTEKKAFLQTELKLEPDRFTILLGTGGAGANNHLRLLDHLLLFKDRIQVIALYGNNLVTKTKLEEWRSRHPDFSLCALPFTDKMAMLLQVSSVVVARPGARTAIESIHCGCPMIFNLLGGVMPQELLAMRYFKKRNIANSIHFSQDLRGIIQSWLDFPETYNQLKQRVIDSQLHPDPEKITKSLMTNISLKMQQ